LEIGHSRVIPLSLAALKIFDGLSRRVFPYPLPVERIFPFTPNAFRLAWERLLPRAKIEDLHFHDLRHEAISRFFEMGLTVPEVALLSGQRDIRMLLRYGHPQWQRVLKQFDNTNDCWDLGEIRSNEGDTRAMGSTAFRMMSVHRRKRKSFWEICQL